MPQPAGVSCSSCCPAALLPLRQPSSPPAMGAWDRYSRPHSLSLSLSSHLSQPPHTCPVPCHAVCYVAILHSLSARLHSRHPSITAFALLCFVATPRHPLRELSASSKEVPHQRGFSTSPGELRLLAAYLTSTLPFISRADSRARPLAHCHDRVPMRWLLVMKAPACYSSPPSVQHFF